jgi:hypothetical protein
MEARPPNDWPQAQAEFHSGYDADPSTFQRTPVWWRVVRRVRDRDYHYKGEGLLDRLGVVDVPRHPVVAVWPAEATGGEPALLVLDAGETDWLGTKAAGPGDLVGEAAMNGAFCIDTGHGVIWPTYNPRIPALRRPRR